MTAMQSAVYAAACPSCAGDADWHAAATSTSDLARTTVTYRIECEACGDQPTELPVVTESPLITRATWLRCTA